MFWFLQAIVMHEQFLTVHIPSILYTAYVFAILSGCLISYITLCIILHSLLCMPVSVFRRPNQDISVILNSSYSLFSTYTAVLLGLLAFTYTNIYFLSFQSMYFINIIRCHLFWYLAQLVHLVVAGGRYALMIPAHLVLRINLYPEIFSVHYYAILRFPNLFISFQTNDFLLYHIIIFLTWNTVHYFSFALLYFHT